MLQQQKRTRGNALASEALSSRKEIRSVNLRGLIATLVVCAVGGTGIHYWHNYQAKRGARALLDRAEQLQELADYSGAASQIFRYTRLQPDDTQALVQLAEVYDHDTKNAGRVDRAIELYYQALAVADEARQEKLRRRLVVLLLKQRRFLEAETEARKLVFKPGSSVRLHPDADFDDSWLLAQSLLGRYETGGIAAKDVAAVTRSLVNELRHALDLRLAPDPVESLANLLHDDAPQLVILPRCPEASGRTASEKKVEPPASMSKDARVAEAKRLMNELVEQHPDLPAVWLTRSRYRMRKEADLKGAEADISKAMEIGASNLDVRLAAADFTREKAATLMRQEGWTRLADDGDVPAAGKRKVDDIHTGTSAAENKVSTTRQLLEVALDHFRFVLNNVDQSSDKGREMRQLAVLGVVQMSAALGDEERAIEILKQELESAEDSFFAMRWNLANLLLAEGDFETAYGEITSMKRFIDALDSRPDRYRFFSLKRSYDLMTAKCAVGRKEFAGALPLLERVTAGQPTSQEARNERYQAHVLAGICHQEAGRHDLAAQAFANAASFARDRVSRVSTHSRAAGAWETAGATDNAIAECRRALAVSSDEAPGIELQLQLTRNLLLKQQQLPADERNWDDYLQSSAAMAAAVVENTLRDSWRFALLEADYELVRAAERNRIEAGREKAFAIVAEAETQNPDDAALMGNLVFIYQRIGKPECADRVLERFQSLTEDKVSGQIAAARLRIQRKDYDGARRALERSIDDASSSDRVRIGKVRAQIEFAAGNYDQADDVLAQLADIHTDDLSIVKMQMQIAFEKNDTAAIRNLEKTLSDAAQSDDRWNVVMKIQRLMADSTSASDGAFLESLDMLSRLESACPAWSVVHTLRGQAEEKRGNVAEASRAYERAVELGDHRIAVYERLIATLYQLTDFQKAESYLTRIETFVPMSGGLSTVAMSVADVLGDKNKAVEVARRAVEQRPDDPMARAWYGQMLLRAQRIDEAERVLRETLERVPTDVISWNGMFEFYRQTGDKDQARETLRQMAANVNLPIGQLSFVLAQGYESLGDHDEAEKAYREALDKSHQPNRIRMRFASFCLARARDGDANAGQQAIDALREILRVEPGNRETKRRLAHMLASVGGEEEWKEVVKLTEELTEYPNGSVVDRRLRAMLLFQRGGEENLKQARAILEELVELADIVPNDRLLLARILERQRDVERARQQYALLAASNPPDPGTLAPQIDFLIRHDDLENARRWLVTLKTAQEAFNVNAVRLEARILDAEGKTSQIQRLIEPLAETQLTAIEDGGTSERIELLVSVGSLYSEFGLHSAAEKWNRQLAKLGPSQFARLAICLARQGKMDEAIDVCMDAATQSDFPAAFAALTAVLTAGKPSPAHFKRAEGMLVEAERRYGGSPNVLLAISSVRIVENQMDEAIRLLEKVIELEPKNVVALNNLASIMAERPELRPKAIEYIDRAIKITGPRPDYYDTKGSILVYDNEPRAALSLLESAVASGQRDPRFQFHLAAACFRLNDLKRAAKHFRESLEADLEGTILTQTDRELMADMQVLLQ